MNHYPHHLGDYAKDTLGFSMLEHGAYRLLLDAYYASESPPASDEVYAIAKAGTPAERKSVDKVLKKFDLRDGHYFHKRVEAELVEYRKRSKTAADKANKKWAKERADKMLGQMPQHMQEQVPQQSHSNAGAMLASSHKPEELQNPPLASATKLDERRATADVEALSLDEARIHPDTPTGHLASVCFSNGIRATAHHPLIVEWARDGVTIDRLKDAIATARLRKSVGDIPLSYLSKILGDTTPKMDYSWKHDDTKALSLCRELGIPGPKGGEQYPEYHARIERALHDRSRRNVA